MALYGCGTLTLIDWNLPSTMALSVFGALPNSLDPIRSVLGTMKGPS